MLWKGMGYAMIIVAGGGKGGSGKSTIATHLAIMRAQAGHDVLLIDADDQETAADFTVLRNATVEGGAGYTCIKLTGPAVRTELERIAPKYDDVIVDAGGRDTVSQRAALVLAHVLLVPFVPRSFDIWTLDTVATLIQEIRTVNPRLAGFRVYQPRRSQRYRQHGSGAAPPGKGSDRVSGHPDCEPQGLRESRRAGACRNGAAPERCKGKARDHGTV
jgi:cellulose biosynthesis protein BcsQ